MERDHILNHTKIIADFNISKKVSEKELVEIKNRVNKVCDDKTKLDKLFKSEILRYTNNYLQSHTIPGLIVKENDEDAFKWIENTNASTNRTPINRKVPKTKKYKSLYNDAMLLSNHITNMKKLSDEEIMFFIISLVEGTGLTEEDFERFYNKIKSKEINFDDEDVDEDDEEDEE